MRFINMYYLLSRQNILNVVINYRKMSLYLKLMIGILTLIILKKILIFFLYLSMERSFMMKMMRIMKIIIINLRKKS